jgi:hexosaminidase
MGWGAEDLPYRLANAGFPVVLAPVTNLYFDLAYNKNPEEPGLNWGGYNDLADSFGFIPFDYYKNAGTDRHGNPLDRSILVGKDRLTEYGQGNILGIEGCLWSETLTWDGALDYMLLPKLLGLAERAWAPDPAWARETDAAKAAGLQAEAWSQFVNTVGKRLLPRLDQEGLNWRYRIPPPGLERVEGEVRCNLQIPGFILRYTTDGSDPTASSPEVRGPIREKGLISVAAFTFKGRHGGIFRIENR